MISNIQGLRAFAAINIVFVHAIHFALSNGFESKFAYFFRDWGSNGVDVFFVISGFIIYYINQKKNYSGFDFILC